MPKVSVIVPVYGVEKYIERCARSLFEQTLDDIEYLFIDDCTPDKSIEILKNVLEEYPHRKNQVIIHRMEKNCGQAAVRKWGVLNATGIYVIHCDSDDWVDVTMYEKMYNKAIEENADIVICQYARTDGVNFEPDLVYFNRETHLSDMMLEKTNWSLCTRLCQRSLYDNISYPTQNMGEDCRIVLQLSLKSKNIVNIPKVYYYYYFNPDSICNAPSKDSSIERYNQVCENVGFVINMFIENRIFTATSAEILNLKNHCRLNLIPFLKSWRFYKLWISTFPEINLRFIYTRGLSFRQRLRFYSRMLGIYPLIAKLLHG